MEKYVLLRRKFFKVLMFIISGFFPIDACTFNVMYGTPIAVNFTFTTKTASSVPIAGLELTLTAGSSNLTTLTSDSNGNASYYYNYGYTGSDPQIEGATNLTLTVHDPDGAANEGSFADLTTNVNVAVTNYDITMK